MEENNYSSEELLGGIGKELQESAKNNITKAVFFKVISICTLIVGLIAGIVCGDTYELAKITYKYPNIKEGEEIVQSFNAPLMLYVWIGTILFALAFWAVYCHLKNQESIIDIIKNNIK